MFFPESKSGYSTLIVVFLSSILIIALKKRSLAFKILTNSKVVYIKPYIDEMKHLYCVADFIISRAGAGSISELSCVAKPSLLIPSPNVSENHQWHNANVLAKKNAVLLIKSARL